MDDIETHSYCFICLCTATTPALQTSGGKIGKRICSHGMEILECWTEKLQVGELEPEQLRDLRQPLTTTWRQVKELGFYSLPVPHTSWVGSCMDIFIREYCSGNVLGPAFLKPSFGCIENRLS